MPHSHVFAIELGRQATAKIAVIPKEHNTWELQSPRHLRLRDVAEISELSGLLEAARREAAQGLPFVDDALLAHQKLSKFGYAAKLSMHRSKPSQKQMYG